VSFIVDVMILNKIHLIAIFILTTGMFKKILILADKQSLINESLK